MPKFNASKLGPSMQELLDIISKMEISDSFFIERDNSNHFESDNFRKNIMNKVYRLGKYPDGITAKLTSQKLPNGFRFWRVK